MSAQLSIRRLNATYIVPRELPDAGAARSQLDGAMRRRLASMCRQLLPHVLDESDTSVWLIRQLDLDLSLDVGVVDEELLTRAWATRIAASLARTIARGADGQRVMRFPDRAAYLAHFLRDLAEGMAWEKWHYEPLSTLRSLQSSAAMREALLREPEQMENVLLHLARRGWLEQSLSVMTEGDVLRVYEACAGPHLGSASPQEERKIIEALLAVWRFAAVRPTQSGIAQAHNALKLYLALRLKSPDVANLDSLASAINHLLGFVEILRRTNELDRLLSSLCRGKLGEAIEQARAVGVSLHLESLPFIQRLAGGDEVWLAGLAQAVSNNVPAALSSDKETEPRIINSTCGGLFLLMPAMLDLNLHRVIEAAPYPDPEKWKQEQLLRYLLFLKLVRSRSIDAAYDFVPRYLAGFDDLPPLTALHHFSQAATDEMNQVCLWLLVEELARCGRTDGNYLAAEWITSENTSGKDEVLLLRDIATDAWVYAAPCGDGPTRIRETLERGLTTVREVTGNSPACLLIEKSLDTRLEVATLAGILARATPDERTRAMFSSRLAGEEELPSLWTGGGAELPEHLIQMLDQYLLQRRPAAPDLAYFSLMNCDPAIIADDRFDLVWSLVARATMKEFALRLMNFGWSSAEYLSRNFLEGMSTLLVESGRVDVRLARAPLHVMLSIAGMNEQLYTVPWLNNTQVALSLMPE